ncbi:hypothetical protein [Oryza sativa Japonica Group]|uniref:Uncharacterized protein n=1 Tax=Oryza sativa subsp. japonica TaxID=39947 RepID=Q5QLE4_ORYSJ|nr:hypothetical protein [Oryza sativa Japonica Group]
MAIARLVSPWQSPNEGKNVFPFWSLFEMGVEIVREVENGQHYLVFFGTEDEAFIPRKSTILLGMAPMQEIDVGHRRLELEHNYT